MFNNIFQELTNKKYSVLFGLIVFVILALQGISNFRFDASSETLVLDNDESFNVYEEVNEQFGTSDFVIVAAQSQNLFSQKKLFELQVLKEKIENISEIESVISILDAPIFMQPKVSLFKSASNDKYLLQDEIDLKLAQEEFASSPIFSELVLSKNGSVTAFQINLAAQDDYTDTIREIRKILDNNQDFNLYLAGPAMIVVDTIDYIKSDVFNFGFLTLIIFSLLLLLFLRSVWITFVIMANASLVVFFTLSLLGINNWPISIVSSNFIALLLISSIAISVHIVVKLQDDLAEKRSAALAFSQILVPCFYAALTTMVGFASLVLSDIKPVIDFGKMMAVGVSINLLISFIFIPIANAFKPLITNFKTNISQYFINNISLPLKSFLEKYSIVGSLALIPVFIYLSMQLKVENKFIDYFNESTEIYQGMSLIDRELGGTTPIDIVLTLPEEEIIIDEDDFFFSEDSEVATYWWREKNMELLKSLKNSIDDVSGVGKVLSIANGAEFAENLNDGFPIGEAGLVFLKNSLLENDQAKQIVDEYLTEDERSTRISLRTVDSMDGLSRNELLNEINAVLSAQLEGTDVSFYVSGLGVLYNNLLQSLFSSQIKTFGVVFGAIFFMLLLLFRSAWVAFSIILVPSIAVGLVLSLMSVFSIPLDIMTITIASICIGMSVDYSIHFSWKYLRNKERIADYYDQTILSTGRAILITGTTIILGFAVFIFSNFNPTALFGILSAIAICVSMLLSMLTLPRFLNLNSK
jgi:predicted RND superfamily exporter protein